ncbi:PepSY-associated TM helix domain-containing protein [Hymenobacter sp. DH14]|uniref:PepSY-associated TM helix domain-containing protein n=1 Tax=Hymenobacter cyanobacteriorum TaxID=2926463 RepID=A0A9X1VDA0_9BACT|nr:PepSY-associated TM helix domain-containing protein [Hymenobacter cyanobacteriorum]MCI1187019.1 PepSY-associated TM helix domain-containing protein [Hymenobacter cyanobacteriorum]
MASSPAPFVPTAGRSTGSPAGPPKSKLKKRTASWSRWLHVYLSMVSFFVVLFFSVTGITLNHADWFDGQQAETKRTGAVPAAWVHVPDTARINKLAIVELLRSKYALRGAVSEFEMQDDQCAVSFKGPGYSADAFINRQDGTFELTELRQGLVAVLNDLHKGRDTGAGWSWVIDLSAGFLTLVSLSGLVMLFFLKNKRVRGLLVAVVGGALCWLAYALLVP